MKQFQSEDLLDLSQTGDDGSEDVYVFPASFAQQRLWFLHKLNPDSPCYNVFTAAGLIGLLDLLAIEKTLSEIVRRHEVLRTTFSLIDGVVSQVIAEPHTLGLPVVDLRELSEAQQETEKLRIATEEAHRAFDLECGPLLRVNLLRLNQSNHIVLFNMHHIVSDSWSATILIREIATLYESFAAGRPSPLPELPIQYADFACWQRQYLQGEVMERHLDYWKRQLGGKLPVLDLSTVHPRPATQSHSGSYYGFRLPAELYQRLTALSSRQGVTLFMSLLAVFYTLLFRRTGQHDIIIGSAIANRSRSELEGLIGFFVNILALRMDLSGNPKFVHLLEQVRKRTLEAYEYQDLPFEKLVEKLQPERNPNRAPLFQVAFGLNNTPRQRISLTGLDIELLNVERQAVRFDLTLWMKEHEGTLHGTWTYSTDLFDASAIIRMTEQFEALLCDIVAHPEARLSSLNMLTESEKKHREQRAGSLESVYTKKLGEIRRKAITMVTDETGSSLLKEE